MLTCPWHGPHHSTSQCHGSSVLFVPVLHKRLLLQKTESRNWSFWSMPDYRLSMLYEQQPLCQRNISILMTGVLLRREIAPTWFSSLKILFRTFERHGQYRGSSMVALKLKYARICENRLVKCEELLTEGSSASRQSMSATFVLMLL